MFATIYVAQKDQARMPLCIGYWVLHKMADMLAILFSPIVWHSFAISYTASSGVPVLCGQQC